MSGQSRLRISNRFRRSLPAQHVSYARVIGSQCLRCRASDDSKSGGSDSSSGSGGDDAAGDSGGDEPNNEPISLESIFAEEMKRRQSGGARVGGGVAPEEQFDWVKTREKRESEAKFKDERMSRDQLKASRELQSEGLEGLPDRAKQLLTLGGLSFVPFLPFIVVGALVFATTWVYFGDAFVHGGDNAIDYGLPDSETPAQLSRAADTRKAGAPPPYVPPEVLLAEPSADGPMVNFKENRP